MHSITSSVMRSGHRKKKLIEVQQEKGRSKYLLLCPGAATRWGSQYDEATRTNIVMGDLCDTIEILIDESRWTKIRAWSDDDDNTNTKEDEDPSWGKYSEHEKMILRQYEGGFAPARHYVRAAQPSKTPSIHERLFEGRWTIQEMKSSVFVMADDLSHKAGVDDLLQ